MLTKEQAIALCESRWWESANIYQRAKFQLFQERLCMPFDVFHAAVEKVLARSVWTHEFAHPDDLRAEFLGEKPAPTMEEIINLIPAEKRVIIETPQEQSNN